MRILATIISFLAAGVVHAANIPYTDVPKGVWYEKPVQSFLNAGYLDASQAQFRPDASATRAEFLKVLVEINGGILNVPSTSSVFDDVAVDSWYHPYFAEAKREKWVMGEGKCAETAAVPCNARPDGLLTRAEAATLIVRAFGFQRNREIAQFKDNPEGSWFADDLQTAADNCVIDGAPAAYTAPAGASRGLAYPLRLLNRAEMVTMLSRVDEQLSGMGPACETR